MLRHQDKIRLTPKEKQSLDSVAGYRQAAPTTVDEFNRRLEAAAELWTAGDTPEERLAAVLARTCNCHTRSQFSTRPRTQNPYVWTPRAGELELGAHGRAWGGLFSSGNCPLCLVKLPVDKRYQGEDVQCILLRH